MTRSFTIREYRDQDEEALVGLLRELQAFEFPFSEHYKPPDAIGTWYVERLKQKCAELDGVIFVALADGAYAGMAVLLTRMEEKGEEEELPHVHAHINELIVTAAARGRGIGRALIAACEQRAMLVGRAEITLTVFARNRPARRVYEAAGFEDVMIRQRKKLGTGA